MNAINQRGLAIFHRHLKLPRSTLKEIPRIKNGSQVRFSRSTAIAESAERKTIADENGNVVLYRGPPAMKPWLYYFMGGSFLLVGVELAHIIYYHLRWPLFSRDPNRTPEPFSDKKKIVGATFALGSGTMLALLCFMVPSSNITRLTLNMPKRELILRTAVRGFSALPPRWIYPSALRRTAELRGYYLTPFNNERIVPLNSVFRVRGSASSLAGSQSAFINGTKRAGNIALQRGPKKVQQYDFQSPRTNSIDFKTGNDRLWYTLEAFGGESPQSFAKSGRSWYVRFWYRISYWMRGYTDWKNLSKEEMMNIASEIPVQHVENLPSGGLDAMLASSEKSTRLEPKQPWFSDRQTFDDVIPRIKRK